MSSSSSAVTPQPFTRVQMNQCLEALRTGFDRAEVIHRGENRIVIRWRRAEFGDSVVIKMWLRPDLKGRLRRLLRVASSEQEWRNLMRLSNTNLAVPRPLGCCPVMPHIVGYTDALFMEDLGNCELSTEYLKRLIQAGQAQKALLFENALIEMTAQILSAGMLDVDHGLANIVVQPSGRPVRLDLELARRVIRPRLFANMYGEMLGRLIGMHAFAVQPDAVRSTRFSERLCEHLQPPRRVLKRASLYAAKMMKKQFEETGIDTRLNLPWEGHRTDQSR